MLELFSTIIPIVISVGAIIVSVTTQLNHVKHVKDDVDRHAANIKDLYIKIDAIHERMGEINGDLKAMSKVCEERHRS